MKTKIRVAQAGLPAGQAIKADTLLIQRAIG